MKINRSTLKIFVLIMVCAYLSMICTIIVWSVWFKPNVILPSSQPALLKFSSYQELKAFLNRSSSRWHVYFEAFRGSTFGFSI